MNLIPPCVILTKSNKFALGECFNLFCDIWEGHVHHKYHVTSYLDSAAIYTKLFHAFPRTFQTKRCNAAQYARAISVRSTLDSEHICRV